MFSLITPLSWECKNQFFWPIESQTVCPTLHQLGNSRVIKLHSISVLCLLLIQELLTGPHKGYFLYELFVEVLGGWSQLVEIVILVPNITIIKISHMHWCFLLGKVFSFLCSSLRHYRGLANGLWLRQSLPMMSCMWNCDCISVLYSAALLWLVYCYHVQTLKLHVSETTYDSTSCMWCVCVWFHCSISIKHPKCRQQSQSA